MKKVVKLFILLILIMPCFVLSDNYEDGVVLPNQANTSNTEEDYAPSLSEKRFSNSAYIIPIGVVLVGIVLVTIGNMKKSREAKEFERLQAKNNHQVDTKTIIETTVEDVREEKESIKEEIHHIDNLNYHPKQDVNGFVSLGTLNLSKTEEVIEQTNEFNNIDIEENENQVSESNNIEIEENDDIELPKLKDN